MTISLINGLGWADAHDITTVLSTEYPGIIIHDSTAVYGNISSGDSLYNINDTKYGLSDIYV